MSNDVHSMNANLIYLAIIVIPINIKKIPIQQDQLIFSPNKNIANIGTIVIAKAENGYAKVRGIRCNIYNQNNEIS